MEPLVLEKLQWPALLNLLASEAQTTAGRTSCLNLTPKLDEGQIQEIWSRTEALKDLIRSGYRPPLGELPALDKSFRAASLEQTLDGEALRDVFGLLQMVKRVQQFSNDFAGRCPPLKRFEGAVYGLPKLAQAIETAISPEGQILDTASPELQKIRRNKLALRKTIESDIKAMLSDHDLESYLQDKFFTVRADRYVVPIKLDGRGRVKGSIQDTSDSGHTLFIEPEEIKSKNDKLLDLELNEKLEILRIYRTLSLQVAAELEILKTNYDCLVDLDILTARACFAATIDGVQVAVSPSPCLHLRDARHPLVKTPGGSQAIGNDILLDERHNILIVSGPNAGGKTIVLKTVGLLHIMARAGLLLPVHRQSSIYLPKRIFLEMGDSQNLEANLSTFSGHVLGLKPILEEASATDLVLLDELAVGTEPQTGSAIGQAVLEAIADKQAIGIVTTHFDSLKGLALQDQRFRNGSMDFSIQTLQPTYKLVLDIPGQSHGLEVAEQMGLPKAVIARAKQLRGASSSEMDRVIEDMLRAKEQAEDERKRYQQLRLESESQKHRWEQDRQSLMQSKEKASEKIKNVYQDQIDKMKLELRDSTDHFKNLLKKLNRGLHADSQLTDSLRQSKNDAEDKLKNLETRLDQLGDEYKSSKEAPGEPVTIDKLQVGSQVYVLSLGQKATVTKVQTSPPSIEIRVGLLKAKPAIEELRLLKAEAGMKSSTKSRQKNKTIKPSAPTESSNPSFVVSSPTNTLDLRGHDSEGAMDQTWAFLDKAVLRGETQLMLIHGHGTDRLKKTIRTALTKDSPYSLDFRPGSKEEGGDGVTVVELKL